MSDHCIQSNISHSKSSTLESIIDVKKNKKPKKNKSISVISVDSAASSRLEIINTPPKPYLSIIDFNLLTRGGLEEAANSNKSFEKVCPHHSQKPKQLEPRKSNHSS
jgi:hypothetical protein